MVLYTQNERLSSQRRFFFHFLYVQMSKTRRAQEITVPQEWKKDEKKKPAAEMMRGGHGSAMSDGALNNNDNFRSTQKLRRHDCEDGSAENQVDSATKAADVYASPV